MICEQIQEHFVPYLLGELPSEEAELVEVHVASGCLSCARELKLAREALELAFESIQAVHVSDEQQRRIVRQALRSQPPASTAHPAAMSASTAGESFLHDALQPARLFQSLLSLAAGFFVMLGAQGLWSARATPGNVAAQRTTAGTTAGTPSLPTSGWSLPSTHPRLMPDAQKTVRFVSLTAQPTQPVLTGYFLDDRFSGELHVVGSIHRTPQPEESFWLRLIMRDALIEVAVAVDVQGRYQCIVPLPTQAITAISLHSESTQ
jgi:hypothetical protein